MEELNQLSETNIVEEQESVSSQEPQSQNSNNHNDSYEKNIIALRLAREKAERERDEYLQRLKEYESKKEKSKETAKETYRDPSDLAEYKDLMELRKEMEAQRAAQEQLALEIKLRQSYPDIDEVLSAENIARFREQEPELAAMLNENKNIFTKASVAYKYIKRMDGGDQYKKEKEQIAANASKPRSAVSVNKGTPLSSMNDFVENTEEYRKRLYKEMISAINSR